MIRRWRRQIVHHELHLPRPHAKARVSRRSSVVSDWIRVGLLCVYAAGYDVMYRCRLSLSQQPDLSAIQKRCHFQLTSKRMKPEAGQQGTLEEQHQVIASNVCLL